MVTQEDVMCGSTGQYNMIDSTVVPHENICYVGAALIASSAGNQGVLSTLLGTFLAHMKAATMNMGSEPNILLKEGVHAQVQPVDDHLICLVLLGRIDAVKPLSCGFDLVVGLDQLAVIFKTLVVGLDQLLAVFKQRLVASLQLTQLF